MVVYRMDARTFTGFSQEYTQDELDNWCREYNHERAYSSLNDITQLSLSKVIEG